MEFFFFFLGEEVLQWCTILSYIDIPMHPHC